jgi:hypothetical protein
MINTTLDFHPMYRIDCENITIHPKDLPIPADHGQLSTLSNSTTNKMHPPVRNN